MPQSHASLILGLNAAYHESAAALVQGGRVLFAVEEERFTRIKRAKSAQVSNPDQLPWNAIRACLDAAGGARLADLDVIGYALVPDRRLALIGVDPYPVDPTVGFGTEAGEHEFNNRVRRVPQLLSQAAGDPAFASRVRFIPHHWAHAASVFYTSLFPSAAVLVVDGIGEQATAWLARGTPAGLEPLEEVPYPHSLGMLWERVAVYLGFTEHDACKVMGLAAYGDPERFSGAMDRLLTVPDRHGGTLGSRELPFVIDPDLARFRADDVAGLESLFGPRRQRGEPPESPRFAAVAAALQRRTEEAVLTLARRLARATGEQSLAYAGGVALNCVANARLEREGPFESLSIPGAAHDAGTALGAALELARLSEGGLSLEPSERPLTPFLGPTYSEALIDAAIAQAGLTAERVSDSPARAAGLIAEGAIVGWFQGRLEFGPRALGHRSLLADPRHARVRDELNRRIKHREPFRPFAASVLAEDAARWFRFPTDRPGAAGSRDLMVLAYPVRTEQAHRIPAVMHQDGTCRVQTVDRERDELCHALISRFRDLTGVPLVLNTSFNDQEPLVASPDDALATFFRTPIDALFLGDRLVRRPS